MKGKGVGREGENKSGSKRKKIKVEVKGRMIKGRGRKVIRKERKKAKQK